MKKKVSLLLLSLLLVGCGTQNETSDKQPSESTPTTEKTTTVLDVDLSDVLAELSFGFSGSALVTSGYELFGFSDYYHDFAIGDNVYEFTTYTSADQGQATRASVKTSGQYSPFNESDPDSSYLSISELGLDNKIAKYYITDGTNYLKWKESGYYNPFTELTEDDFVKDDTNPYRFHLQANENTSKDGLTALATSLTGQIGLEVQSFTLITDGITATGYDITFKGINSSYGTMTVSAKGEIKEKGDDLVQKVEPVKGTLLPELDQAIQKYQTLSYRVDATLANKLLKAEVCPKGLTYDYYHLNGEKYANYGYYQKGNSVQGITRINGTFYEDGDSISNGIFSQIAPTMAISSVFFKETSESTSDKKIYKFNDDYKDVVTQDSSTFAILKGSTVGELSIIVEKDKLTFENVLSGDVKETYCYYDLGKVSDFTSGIQEDCSSLTWSELLSNQPSDLEKLYAKTIAKDYLDQIPVVGGKRSYTTLNFNAQRGDLAQVLFSISDYNDGVSLIDDYESTMIAEGYTKTEKESTTMDLVFEKKLTANGVEKTVSVEIILGAAWFKTPTVVLYFKLK